MRIAAGNDRPAAAPSIGLAVIGAEFRTDCAPRRQAEIKRCSAGERVTLRALKRLVQGGTGGLAEQRAYLAKLKKVLDA